jgi:hypothetical protein
MQQGPGPLPSSSGACAMIVEVILTGGPLDASKRWGVMQHTPQAAASASLSDEREGGRGQCCRSMHSMLTRLSSGLVGWSHRAAAATAVLLETLMGG